LIIDLGGMRLQFVANEPLEHLDKGAFLVAEHGIRIDHGTPVPPMMPLARSISISSVVRPARRRRMSSASPPRRGAALSLAGFLPSKRTGWLTTGTGPI